MYASDQFHSLIMNKTKGLAYDTTLYQNVFEKTLTRNFIIRLDTMPESIERTKIHKNFEVAQKIGPSTFSLNYANMIDKIKVPVLLISGQYDFLISPDELKRLRNKFPNAEYAIIPNAGHIGFIDNPNDYFPPLIRFIKKFSKY